MSNIISYFNSLLSYIFGGYIRLYSVSDCLSRLSSLVVESSDFEQFLLNLISLPTFWLSFFVWIWFGWLSLHLLLIWPFKWIRSIIRKCKIS